MTKKPDSSSVPAAARFILHPKEVAAAFAISGNPVPDTQLFDAVPVHRGEAPERIKGPDGKLKPALAQIFAVLGEPRGSLALEAISGGATTSLRFMWAKDAPPYLILGMTADGHWDIAALSTVDQALVVIDEVLGISAATASRSGFAVELTPAAFITLTALGDLIAQEDLQRQLRRMEGPGAIPFSAIDAGDLARMVEAGCAAPDLRWGVTLTASLHAETLGAQVLAKWATVQAAEHGLETLQDLGAVNEDGLPTVLGLGLARLLAQPAAAGQIVSAVSDGKQGRVESVFLYRAGSSLGIGSWKEGFNGPAFALAEISAAGALKLIGELMTAKP